MTTRILGQAWALLGMFYLSFAMLVFAQHYKAPVPTPIKTKPMSERSIREEYEREQRSKQTQRATRLAARVYASGGCGVEYAELTGQAANKAGLSPRLLAALVVVESHCNPRAEDGMGSFGLTQVNGKTWHVSRRALMNPRTNLRLGAEILAENMRRFGLVEGLHHYNGYSTTHDHVYVKKVLTAAGMSGRLPS